MNAASLFQNKPKPKGREEAHDKLPCFALRLVLENGNEVSVMYGSLTGSPAYNPSTGIQFVFEALHPEGDTWKEAQWLVTVTGSNLDRVYHHLCLSRQRFIRIGANEDDDGDVPNQDGPEVTGISVTKLKK